MSAPPRRAAKALAAAKPWARAAARFACWFSAACIVSASALALALEAYDRLGSSSPAFAWEQLKREAFGEPTPMELEAKELLGQVKAATGLRPLALVRVGMADGLSAMDFSAQFNPTTFRIALDKRLAQLPKAQRRAIILHEIGHAVAFSAGARPLIDLGDRGANEIIEKSLLSNQIFQESFADVFAASWALRENPADAKAWSTLAGAVASPQAHASPAHETAAAMRLLKPRVKEARSIDPKLLPAFIAGIASQATASTIAQLGAEREAACHMGLRAIARFALDMGYESFTLPWEMAQTHPISPQDPMGPSLAAIAKLRVPGSPPNPWASALARARPAIEESMRAVGRGADPEQASKIAWRGMALGQQDALPPELDAAAFAAKLSASSRSGWRAKAATAALELSEALLPAPTFGCSNQAAKRSLSSSAP